MSFRSFLVLGTVAGLAACQPAIPDSNPGQFVDPGRGVGFDNPNTLAAREARNAQLTTPTVQAAPAVGTQALPPSGQPPESGEVVRTTSTTQQTPRAVSNPASLDAELAQIAAENDATAARGNSGQAVLNASPSNAAPVILNNPGISDENSFDAVSSRQSIESDAARLEANRQQYQVVQPTALPVPARAMRSRTWCNTRCRPGIPRARASTAVSELALRRSSSAIVRNTALPTRPRSIFWPAAGPSVTVAALIPMEMAMPAVGTRRRSAGRLATDPPLASFAE